MDQEDKFVSLATLISIIEEKSFAVFIFSNFKKLGSSQIIFYSLFGSKTWLRRSFFNRYRRGLETCQQAKTSKSRHAISFSFFRRVQVTSMTQRGVENTRVHFWTFSPVSVNKNLDRDLEISG